MAALFAYVSGSSFVLQEQYGLAEQEFGLLFGAGAVFLIGATQANVRLLSRLTPAQALTSGLVGGTVAATALLAVAVADVGLVPLLIALWALLASVGLVMPNAPALALSRHGEAAGTAAALLGAVQFGVGAIAAPLVGVLGTDATAMGLVMLGGTVAASSCCSSWCGPVGWTSSPWRPSRAEVGPASGGCRRLGRRGVGLASVTTDIRTAAARPDPPRRRARRCRPRGCRRPEAPRSCAGLSL